MKCMHIQVENEKITILDELTLSAGVYYTFEYSRLQRKLTQIGVHIDKAAKVIIRQFNMTVATLTYSKMHDIWYHQSQAWISDEFSRSTDSIFGINAGGSFTIIAYSDTHELLAEQEVIITPGTMSLEEYVEMQQEVRRLFEIFSYDLASKNNIENAQLQSFQLPFYPLNTFDKIVCDIEQLLGKISEAPAHKLTAIPTKISRHQIKKWKPKTILAYEVEQTEKIMTGMNIATTDILEHRMIKGMLDNFVDRIVMESKAEVRYIHLLRQEIVEIEQVLLHEPAPSIVCALQNQLTALQSDLEMLQERAAKWNILSQKVDRMLAYDFLQLGAREAEETHLFRMHPLYSELYQRYFEYELLTPEYSPTFRLFIQSILKSPTLYELWILLKIVEHLSTWGVSTKEFIEDMQIKVSEDGGFSGYRKCFRLPNAAFDVALYYDFVEQETGYRPDFVIGLYDKSERKWHIHTLDAKYKDYTHMNSSANRLQEDLIRSGRRYLTELFVDREDITVSSATIVHPDTASTWWNVKDAEVNREGQQHRYAHFSFTPRYQHTLGIYMKRLLHECSCFESSCPKCAQSTDGVMEPKEPFHNKRRWKTTFICEKCEEVWVANFCSSCFYNDRGLRPYYDQNEERELNRPRPLFKYATYNYNIQIEDDWNVHCPTCYKTANHNDCYHIAYHLLTGEVLEKV